MDQSSIIAIVSLVVATGGSVLAVINHTRIRSHCCGKKLEISLDVDKTQTTPPLRISIPEEHYQTVPGSSPQKQVVPPLSEV